MLYAIAMGQIIIIIPGQCLCMLSSWPKTLPEYFRFTWWVQTQRQMAANPPTKPTDLGCESASRRLPSTSPSPSIIITQPESWGWKAGHSPCPRLYIALAVDHCDLHGGTRYVDNNYEQLARRPRIDHRVASPTPWPLDYRATHGANKCEKYSFDWFTCAEKNISSRLIKQHSGTVLLLLI